MLLYQLQSALTLCLPHNLPATSVALVAYLTQKPHIACSCLLQLDSDAGNSLNKATSFAASFGSSEATMVRKSRRCLCCPRRWFPLLTTLYGPAHASHLATRLYCIHSTGTHEEGKEEGRQDPARGRCWPKCWRKARQRRQSLYRESE